MKFLNVLKLSKLKFFTINNTFSKIVLTTQVAKSSRIVFSCTEIDVFGPKIRVILAAISIIPTSFIPKEYPSHNRIVWCLFHFSTKFNSDSVVRKQRNPSASASHS